MKINRQTIFVLLAAWFSLAACSTEVKHEIAQVDAPLFVTSSPLNGSSNVRAGRTTISVVYDTNIFFASKNSDQITLTGGEIVSADVIGSSNTLTIEAMLYRNQSYTLAIPAGLVTGPNAMEAPAVQLEFSTVSIDRNLVNPSASQEAKALYAYLLENYESNTLSGMMANVAWNNEESERIYQLTGKYPAINGYDYLHLPFSPSNWIDYSDITPVTDWVDANGIVTASWHWNVPTVAPNDVNLEVWSGDVEMPSDWSGNVQLTGDAEKALFAQAAVGYTLKVTTQQLSEGAQGSLKNGSWGEIAPGTDYFDISGDYEYVITSEMLEQLQSSGLIVSGHGYHVTGVYLVSLAGNVEYAFYRDQTTYDADNALVEGTWENKVFVDDLATISAHLKLLSDARIPVLWRPFHEAAGGWFWWGKSATSCKAMWIYMFNYFQQQGLNNLIWVWTVETNDDEWYPGDNYVDIVGRDLYTKDANECASQFSLVANSYANKMVTLSECGTVAEISTQWSANAKWLWFMPWYDNAGAENAHASDAWWIDAMNQSYVISRDQVPSFR